MDSILSGTAPSRSAHVLHLAPTEPARLARLALPALAAAADSGGVLRTLILVEDADAAVSVANHAALEIGGGLTPIVALTSSARARRVLAASMPPAVAMPIDVAAALMARSAFPADGIRHLILAMPEEPDRKAVVEALEAVLPAIPKGATRTLVASRETPQVESLVERHFFKARRTREASLDAPRPGGRPVHVMSTAPGARWDALRRLLDEIDPPSAAVLTPDAGTHADAVRALATLGYPPDGLVQAIREDIPTGITLAVIVGVPEAAALQTAITANPVHLVVLCGPREIGDVRAVAGSGSVLPWTLEGPRARAESRVASTRARLREILTTGTYASELAAIGPLLEEFDGSEIAAAALAMAVEAARSPALPVAPMPSAPPQAPRPSRPEARSADAPRGDRGVGHPRGGDRRPAPRPRDDRGARPPARSRNDRDARPPRPRDDRDTRPPRSRDDRDTRPPRSRDDRDTRPPRSRDDRDTRPPRSRDDRGTRPPRPRDDRPRDDRPRKFSDRDRHK